MVDPAGYDMPGVLIGSEGTLGIATKMILRVVKRPEVVQTLLAAFHLRSSGSGAERERRDCRRDAAERAGDDG